MIVLAFVIFALKINLEVCTFDDVIAFVVNNASQQRWRRPRLQM